MVITLFTAMVITSKGIAIILVPFFLVQTIMQRCWLLIMLLLFLTLAQHQNAADNA